MDHPVYARFYMILRQSRITVDAPDFNRQNGISVLRYMKLTRIWRLESGTVIHGL